MIRKVVWTGPASSLPGSVFVSAAARSNNVLSRCINWFAASIIINLTCIFFVSASVPLAPLKADSFSSSFDKSDMVLDHHLMRGDQFEIPGFGLVKIIDLEKDAQYSIVYGNLVRYGETHDEVINTVIGINPKNGELSGEFTVGELSFRLQSQGDFYVITGQNNDKTIEDDSHHLHQLQSVNKAALSLIPSDTALAESGGERNSNGDIIIDVFFGYSQAAASHHSPVTVVVVPPARPPPIVVHEHPVAINVVTLPIPDAGGVADAKITGVARALTAIKEIAAPRASFIVFRIFISIKLDWTISFSFMI